MVSVHVLQFRMRFTILCDICTRIYIHHLIDISLLGDGDVVFAVVRPPVVGRFFNRPTTLNVCKFVLRYACADLSTIFIVQDITRLWMFMVLLFNYYARLDKACYVSRKLVEFELILIVITIILF